jgi:hypothetical protein
MLFILLPPQSATEYISHLTRNSMSSEPSASDLSDSNIIILKRRLEQFMRSREPPKTFCPSEVARALDAHELHQLGYSQWRDAMSAIRHVAWGMRQDGQCEILQKGESVHRDVGPDLVRGPIRIRRVAA